MAVIEVWTCESMPMDVTDFGRWSHPEITFDLIAATDAPGVGPYANQDAWSLKARWRIEVPEPLTVPGYTAQRLV